MASLFIIGNGFDLAHEMKTSYEDFRQYLINNYPGAYFNYSPPAATIMPDGGVSYDDDEVVGFLIRIISEADPKGEEWSDLETALGLLDFGDFLERLDNEDEKEWRAVGNNQDLSANILDAGLKITEYFSEWIDIIGVCDVSSQKDFEQLINKDCDFFLTFNYTSTLEVVYNIRNVCHIHGEQGGELIFGHGNDEDNYEINMTHHVGSESSLQKLHFGLRKNTTKAINDNQDFFNNLSTSINKIYSYGFSFSKVDEVYIKEICNRIPTKNITWLLNDYDDINQRERFKKVIRSCGFQGSFSTYHIRKNIILSNQCHA